MNSIQSSYPFLNVLRTRPCNLDQIAEVSIQEGLQQLLDCKEELADPLSKKLRGNCFVWLYSVDNDDLSTHGKISKFI